MNEFSLKAESSLYQKKAWLFVLLVAVFIPHWVLFFENIDNTISPDLLLRTIGSRLQQAGKSVYDYKWKAGDPTGWLNPYEDKRAGINGVVSTPFVLWLSKPFNNLSYCSIRVIWSCLQEALLFLTFWFCCRTLTKRKQVLFIVIALPFFVYDRNWMLHMYNGQMYVVYAFIFSLSGFLVLRYKKRIFPIFLFPLISLIRPFFLVAFIPFLKKRSHLTYSISAIALAIVIAMTATTARQWKQYNVAMKLYAKEQTNELGIDSTSSNLYWRYAQTCTKNHSATFATFNAGDLYSLQHYLFLTGINISSTLFYQLMLAVSLLTVLYISIKKGWFKRCAQAIVAVIFILSAMRVNNARFTQSV